MGSFLFLASLHPTTVYWAVGKQTENGLLPCSKCAELKFEVWNIQDLWNFWFFKNYYYFYSNGLNLFLQNRWSTMWFTVVCVVFLRDSYGMHPQSKERLARISCPFWTWGRGALERRGNGGFCKIIWPNFYVSDFREASSVELRYWWMCTFHTEVLKKKKLIAFGIGILIKVEELRAWKWNVTGVP